MSAVKLAEAGEERRGLGGAPCARGFAQRDQPGEQERQQRRDYGDPEHRADVVRRTSTISAIAAIGASNAPTVSSDWRRPNARPRISGGVSSAIIASRGLPRMPLPIRSAKRAAITVAALARSGNSGLVNAARP